MCWTQMLTSSYSCLCSAKCMWITSCMYALCQCQCRATMGIHASVFWQWDSLMKPVGDLALCHEGRSREVTVAWMYWLMVGQRWILTGWYASTCRWFDVCGHPQHMLPFSPCKRRQETLDISVQWSQFLPRVRYTLCFRITNLKDEVQMF